jgi:ferric iron reductase protein FhuF
MAKLTKNELDSLRKFRLSTEKSIPRLTINGNDLLDKERIQEIFNGDLKLKLNTDIHQVIGSMLVKRYAFLAALVLYSMSVYNKGINSSLENISLQADETDPLWLPSFYFENLEVTTPEADRDQWRTSVIQTLFLENISKVISSISKHTKISKSILWENTAIYIFWMYESLLEDKGFSKEISSRIVDDFQYVVVDATPQMFGLKAQNPIIRFYRQKQNGVRKRMTCCLFYLTSKNDDRCNSCPIECKRQLK